MMIEKKFVNNELNIELISYVDARQNIWFKGKDIAQALRKHVLEDYKKKQLFRHPVETTGWSETIFIDESGFYELVFSSKLPAAKKIPRLGIYKSTPIHQKTWTVQTI